MPKSKRTRVVALTQTDKRATRQHKSAFIQEVRDAVDNHEQLYLFSFENMRSHQFKEIRMHFRGQTDGMEGTESRIFMGKNKLLQIALGRSPEEEYSDNLHEISKQISGGNIGLLFTSRSREEVEAYFEHFVKPDFATVGFISPKTIMIQNDMLSNFPVSMVEQLRKLGLPNEVDNGKIILQDNKTEFRICKEGEKLSAEKCKLLVHFGIKLSEFSVKLVSRWSDGEFGSV